MTKSRKILSAVVSLSLVLHLNTGILLAAPEAPSSPSAPKAPSSPTSPSIPEGPDKPQSPDAPESPTAPTAPSAPTPVPSPTPSATAAPTASATPQAAADTAVGETDNSGEEAGTGGQSDSGQVGDASIQTGDSTASGMIANDVNTNIDSVSASASSVGVKIADNAAGSENNVDANLDSKTDLTQNNSANVVNTLNQVSTTGKNSTSRNTGGDSEIATGNANITGTIVNSVNTNIAGTAVSEFNISDNHIGDLILDFSKNGSDSKNTANVTSSSDANTFQSNDADVENNLVLAADSGHNNANYNTGGDSTIETGNANVSASVLNFVNNNLSGKLAYAAINIFGDLVGDIILTEQQLSSLFASIQGNGSNSENNVNASLASVDTTNQFNVADIDNNIVLNAQTGSNDTERNTSGQNSITTGDSNAEVQVVNVANMNILTDKLWLVIVNDNGNWSGQVLGTNLSFIYNPDGSILVEGNGTESQNTANLNSTTSSSTTQSNTANIQNNISLSANTGGNSASRNTGGDNTISTGDANIIASIINFANNNIASDAGLFLSVVNVFGSWDGDFIGPDYTKDQNPLDTKDDDSVTSSGAVAENNNSSNSNNSESSSDNGSGTNAQIAATILSGKITPLAASTSANKFVPEVKAAADETPLLADTNGGKNVNLNLAWSIPFAGLLLSVEFMRRRFLG